MLSGLITISAALRSIGCSDGDIMEQLLWSVRCDKVYCGVLRVESERCEDCDIVCRCRQ